MVVATAFDIGPASLRVRCNALAMSLVETLAPLQHAREANAKSVRIRDGAAHRRAFASVTLASAHQSTTTFMLARDGGLTKRNASPEAARSNERPLASK